jgi:lipid-binding SYLF domain-containing protein
MTNEFRARLTIATMALSTAGLVAALAAQAHQTERLHNAAIVLDEIMSAADKAISASVLEKAEAVAVFPSTIKGGFVLAAQRGKGVISVRDPKARTWSMPAFLAVTGGSIGAQIGGQSSDVILVIMNQRGLENLLQNQFKVGADGSVAAGPVGRTAEASTDIQMRAQILSYSRSRGLFAGVSLNGAAITEDSDSNKEFYGEPLTTREIVIEGKAKKPVNSEAVATWRKVLIQYATGK